MVVLACAQLFNRAKQAVPVGAVMTTTATVFFGQLSLRFRSWRPVSPWVWTLLGGFAIPLWATWPALSLKTWDMPPFECLTIVFLVAWLAMLRSEGAVAGNPGAPAPWVLALAFALAEVGSAAFFMRSTHYIAAAEANLIVYLWPAMIVGFGAVLGVFRLRLRHVIGIVLGFSGVAILMRSGTLSFSYWGVGLALLGGLSWALYCLFRLKWSVPAGPFLGRGFGISAAICGTTHLLIEPLVTPSLNSLVAAVAIGAIPTAIANVAWDAGLRRGDSQLLAVMAYGTPLCSAVFLTVLGLEAFTWKLLLGAVVIVVAGIMSRADS
jgi:drug/metabolite transporter (DMT)-like permease